MAQTLLTLSRGLAVLEVIASAEHPVTANELSVASGVNVSTTYQILRTLRDGEYVVRHRGGGYSLGPAVVRMAGQLDAMPNPPPVAERALQSLFVGTGETSYLVGWWLSRIVTCSILESSHALRVGRLDVGYSGAPHARASCKAILAYLQSDDVRGYLASFELDRNTPNTLVSIEAIEADLKRTRDRAYAVDNEEFAVGVVCYSAPVFDAEGFPRYSLTVSLPKARVGSHEPELIHNILGASLSASRGLGYTGPIPCKTISRLAADRCGPSVAR